MTNASSIIALASDHAGVALKAQLMVWLKNAGYSYLDLGTDSDASVDYPDYGHALAQTIMDDKAQLGVAICGSGIGISIAANRHAGIRAALCHTVEAAHLARAHNDANILALGARFISADVAIECLQTFLNTPFEGGRHAARVTKLG